jgi:hypothetical protein
MTGLIRFQGLWSRFSGSSSRDRPKNPTDGDDFKPDAAHLLAAQLQLPMPSLALGQCAWCNIVARKSESSECQTLGRRRRAFEPHSRSDPKGKRVGAKCDTNGVFGSYIDKDRADSPKQLLCETAGAWQEEESAISDAFSQFNAEECELI